LVKGQRKQHVWAINELWFNCPVRMCSTVTNRTLSTAKICSSRR